LTTVNATSAMAALPALTTVNATSAMAA
jgi:hypothetical protein